MRKLVYRPGGPSHRRSLQPLATHPLGPRPESQGTILQWNARWPLKSVEGPLSINVGMCSRDAGRERRQQHVQNSPTGLHLVPGTAIWNHRVWKAAQHCHWPWVSVSGMLLLSWLFLSCLNFLNEYVSGTYYFTHRVRQK